MQDSRESGIWFLFVILRLNTLEKFHEEQKKRLPAIFTKPGFRITAGALNMRSSMDSSDDGNAIVASKLSKGDEVLASPVDD